MRKIANLLILASIIFLFFFTPSKILAQNTNFCLEDNVTINAGNNFNTTLRLKQPDKSKGSLGHKISLNGKSINGAVINSVVTFELGRLTPGDYHITHFINGLPIPCGSGVDEKYIIRVPDVGQGGTTETIKGDLKITPLNPTTKDIIHFALSNLSKDSIYAFHTTNLKDRGISDTVCSPSSNKQVILDRGPFLGGAWEVRVSEKNPKSSTCGISSPLLAHGEFTISASNNVAASLPPTPTPIPTQPPSPPSPCAKWGDRNGNPYTEEQLNQGFRDSNGNLKVKENQLKCLAVNTAIGEISTNPQGFVRSIFSLVLGIAGGIALILIIMSGYRLMASQGNPEQITAARDQLISAIVGLVFIIFSFVILQVIGVDILKIPGFSK